ncbi:MAG TPA: saccharopine dehydrogenase C-terminal domain-containing protein [Flavisolibacter sp.]
MKKILLFGAGKSATVLIDYLLRHSLAENWILTVVDANLELARQKIGNALGGEAVGLDITKEAQRQQLISKADLVISLLPPALHFLVAKDCLQAGKNLLTASYVDEQMRGLQPEIQARGLVFLCEMGLDPGIDHMSAKSLIDEIHAEGGTITSFMSHCGGLVAPKNDDNPWHYKISWNPRNIVMAGKAGALFMEAGATVSLPYEKLFAEKRLVQVPGADTLCWYPNRDSIPYMTVYGLDDCPTFVRTTLRHPDFIYGWKNVIDLSLTDETPAYQTDGKSLKEFFTEHMQRHGFQDWLQKKLQQQFQLSTRVLEDLVKLVGMEAQKQKKGDEPVDEFMAVNDKGALEAIDLDDLKTSAATTVAERMHEAKLTLKQLLFLGMDDRTTQVNKGFCSAADVMQLVLEKKLPLLPGEQDRVVMVHEIEWQKDGRQFSTKSSIDVHGLNDQHTAMAKTVGLPLGIAARLILDGTIRVPGLHIPVSRDIYAPVMAELAKNGIVFKEETAPL